MVADHPWPTYTTGWEKRGAIAQVGNENGAEWTGEGIVANLSQELYPREGIFNAYITLPTQNLKADLIFELVNKLSVWAH